MKTTKILFAVFLCLLIFSQQSNAQKKSNSKQIKKKSSCDEALDYYTALDHLFPKYFLGQGNGYALAFRYTPTESDEPESQITIFHPEPGTYETYLYKPIKGNINLQFQKIEQQKGCVTYQDVIKLIKIEKVKIGLNETEIKKIREGFFDALKTFTEFEKRTADNNSNKANILLDGTGYEAEYYGIGNIKLLGEGYSIDGKPFDGEPPFVEWMRNVYRTVERKK